MQNAKTPARPFAFCILHFAFAGTALMYTLGILGGGRAAWAFGATWRRLGWPIDGVWLRPESPSRLPELLEAPRKSIDDLDADLLLIAVSDRAVDEVLQRAKAEGGRAKG